MQVDLVPWPSNKWVRGGAVKGIGRIAIKFQIPSSTKYPCA